MPDINYQELGKEVAREMSPMFLKIGRDINKLEMKPNINVAAPVIPEIKIPEITVTVPEIKVPEIPEINIPEIQAPNVIVNVDKVRIDNLEDIRFPEIEFDLKPILKELKKLQEKTGGASGPTEYKSGDAYVNGPFGHAMLWEKTSSVLSTISAANPLPVDIQDASIAVTGPIAVTGTFWQNTQPISGAVTANAGTNLNTSALALESGGNLEIIADATKLEDSGHTTGDRGMAMLGVRNEGADDFSGTDKDYIPIALDAKGHVFVRNSDEDFDVGIQPRTSGGLLIANFTSGDGSTALTNSAQVIKATAGQLFGWYIFNPNTVTAWVIIYNTAAASVTVGTTSPAMVLGIPAGSAANVVNPIGIQFTNAGWSASAVMTTASGNTAPTVALDVLLFYK